ncbi:hypothetical protein DPEC_G00134150 [Dallia pectoralis]|uniref:Uncharacterized protein n=1 Tax=Dallia pectoralis TaxID=75939 RepID=A0ACC2GRT4_DALPE|nr:hypothetical protein DPEC_G00134150 [Dallia pectoralis]
MEGPEYFRVIHDRQVKVCRVCIQPGHVVRECPDFFCRRCKAQGHYARECNQQQESRCSDCGEMGTQCVCLAGLLGGVVEMVEETDEGAEEENDQEEEQQEDVESDGEADVDQIGPSLDEAVMDGVIVSGEDPAFAAGSGTLPGTYPGAASAVLEGVEDEQVMLPGVSGVSEGSTKRKDSGGEVSLEDVRRARSKVVEERRPKATKKKKKNS